MIECRTKDFVSDFISVVKSLNSLSVAVLLPSLITKSSARRYTDFGLSSLLTVIRKKYLCYLLLSVTLIVFYQQLI